MKEKERKAVYQFINVVNSLASFHVYFVKCIFIYFAHLPFLNTLFSY